MNHAVRIPVEDRTKADVAGRAVDISRLAERAQIEGTVILVIYPLACIDPGIATGLIERAGSVAKGFRNGKILDAATEIVPIGQRETVVSQCRAHDLFQIEQIGRAACRERVWQYV